MARIFGEDAVPVTGLWCFPFLLPCPELLCRNVEFNKSFIPVEGDQIAISHQGDRPANKCLWRHVTHDPSPRAPGETTIGNEGDRVEQTLANERCRRRKHLRHTWATLRTLVADNNDISGLDFLREDRLQARRF